LIIQLINCNLIDEFQICIHLIIEGKGLSLFDQIKNRTVFKLIRGFKKNKSNISDGFVFEIFAVGIKIVYPLRGKNSISYRIVLQYFIHYVEFAIGDKVL